MQTQQQDDDIIVTGEITNEPCPLGTWPAVCVDVARGGTDCKYDAMGKVTSSWDYVYLVFQVFPFGDGIPTAQSDGRPFQVDCRFISMLTPDAPGKEKKPGQHNLRTFLEQWRNKNLTIVEIQNFVLTRVKNAPAFLTVDEQLRKSTPYSIITTVAPYVDSDGKPIDPRPQIQDGYVRADYIGRLERMKNRGGQAQAAAVGATMPAQPQAKSSDDEDDEYTPF
ncbi:hypothetical protein [Bacteriophage sp.]|nr:hypothetical protein [Bacteriophage sp.]